MMMSGRVPDHVFGGTVFLASPTRPSPTQSRGFSLQRGEARPKGRCSWLPNEEGEKNFYLEELKLFLVKVSVLRLAGGIISAPCQDRFTPCPLPPSARLLLIPHLMNEKAGLGFKVLKKKGPQNRKNEKMPKNSQFWACFGVFE